MLLVSFMAELTGVPGRHLSCANPQTMEHALTIALAVQEAEKQESFNESFYTRFDNSVGLLSRSPSRECHEDNNPRRSADTHAVNHIRVQRYKSPRSTSKPLTSDTMNSQTQTALRCYECEGLGHR